MPSLTAFFSGLIFGIGLIIAGMTDTEKVLGFLDLAGSWDPSLALVMGGAIFVGFFAFRSAAGRTSTLLGTPFTLPKTEQRLDPQLIWGSILFGTGWGLAGFCPGPALASLLTGGSKAIIFVIAMLAGMLVFTLQERHASNTKSSALVPK